MILSGQCLVDSVSSVGRFVIEFVIDLGTLLDHFLAIPEVILYYVDAALDICLAIYKKLANEQVTEIGSLT